MLQLVLKVCEEEKCGYEVFPLSVSYLDRFLSIEAVHKTQLQVLGTACMFLASKIVDVQPLVATRLIQYTANAVTLPQLLSWELLILNRLKWDICSPTPYNFLQHFLYRLRFPASLEYRVCCQLRVLVSLLLTEVYVYPPSFRNLHILRGLTCLSEGENGNRRKLRLTLIFVTASVNFRVMGVWFIEFKKVVFLGHEGL
ncbi:unnamed protein product [Soboliphyme baturini]|uniref:CYCLIN domain-containing protein n=1 Tax=Soboliphyme baturini TaxID=241478 RepID=A0A183J1S3_9BILA|nr:unnamed protein product [Soboliphyme baturini]